MLGVTAIVKSPAVTTRFADAVLVRLPLFAATVNVYVPGAVPAGTRTTSRADPGTAVFGGARTPVAPLGSPLTERSTVPANPFEPVTVTVYATAPVPSVVAVVGEIVT